MTIKDRAEAYIKKDEPHVTEYAGVARENAVKYYVAGAKEQQQVLIQRLEKCLDRCWYFKVNKEWIHELIKEVYNE